MRLLFLTCHLPYPPHSGGRLREYELLARLTQRHDIYLAAVTKTLAEDEAAVASIPWDHDGISLFPAAQLVGLSGVAPQVARHRSEAASARIGALLAGGGFDLVHVEGFYLWQHLPPVRPGAILVEQNIEWQLYAQRQLRAEAVATRQAEVEAWRAADVLGALTREDCESIDTGCGRTAHLIPDGADHLRAAGAPPARLQRPGRRLVMVGNFAYEPNVDGALWLAEEVMPRLPGAELQLVGTSPPPEIEARGGERIEVTGRVPDVRPYLEGADVVVCPLRCGGGVKVKTLEALSLGKAIVGTEIACQGLGDARRAIRVADSAEDFAAAAAELLADAAARRRLERAAATAAADLPRWDDVADALEECWQLAARQSLAAA